MSRRLLAAFVTLVITSGLGACRRQRTETMEDTGPLVVRTERVVLDTIRATVAVAGAVAPSPGADWIIVAPDSARVAHLPKAEGDVVKGGEVLVRFDVPSIVMEQSARRAELAQATARLQSAKAAASRIGGLFARGIVPQKEDEDATRELREAESAVAHATSAQQIADTLSAHTAVTARFDGVVLKRFHNVGDQVEPSPSDPVLRVIDPTRLEVVGTIPANQAALVRPGSAARIVNPMDGSVLDGTVITVSAVTDPAAATVDVRVALPKPAPPPVAPAPGAPPAPAPASAPGATAKPIDVPSTATLTVGMPVSCEILAEERAGAMLVPAAAILREGLQAFVMVAGSDGKAHRKPVMVGLIARERAQIVSGLTVGEYVIIAGAEPVPDGATITVQK